MLQPNPEVRSDGPEGLIFLSEIKTLSDLSRTELALWLGRGAWAGATVEQRKMAQTYLEDKRSSFIEELTLDQADVV